MPTRRGCWLAIVAAVLLLSMQLLPQTVARRRGRLFTVVVDTSMGRQQLDKTCVCAGGASEEIFPMLAKRLTLAQIGKFNSNYTER